MLAKHHAPEPGFAFGIDDPVDRQMIGRNRRPDRQQEAGRDTDDLSIDGLSRFLGLGRPGRREDRLVARLPRGFKEVMLAKEFAPRWAEQFDTRDRRALLGHAGTRPGLERDLAGTAIAQKDCGMVGGGKLERALERHRVASPCDFDRQQVRGRAAHGIGAQ